MKTIFIIIALTSFFFTTENIIAQSSDLTIHADFLSRPSLQSVKGGGGLCFLKRQKKNTILTIVDEGLKPIVQHPIEMPSDMTLAQCVFNGEYYLAEFRLFRGTIPINKLFFYVFDTSGALVFENRLDKQKEADIQCDRQIYPAENGNFIITENGRDKKEGLIVYRINHKMDILWESFFGFENEHLILTDFDYHANRLIFTGRRGKINEKKSHRNDLFFVDGQTGKMEAQIPLHSNEQILMPSMPLIEDNGAVVISGSYFNSGKKISFDNSNGIFLNKYDAKGNLIFKKSQSWESIVDLSELRKKLKVLKVDQAKIQTYTVSKKGEKYLVLAEFFGKTLTGTSVLVGALENEPYTGLSLMDFVILEFDEKSDSIQNVFSIPKEPEFIDNQAILNNDDLIIAYYFNRPIERIRRKDNSDLFGFTAMFSELKTTTYFGMLDLTKEGDNLQKFETQPIYLNPFNGKSQTLSLGKGKIANCTFDKKSGEGYITISFVNK